MPDVVEKGNDGITLKIKINPKLIERLFYLAVIIVLAVFIILGTFCDKACETAEEETKETTSAETETTTQEAEEETEAAEVEEVEEEEIEEPEVNDTEEINDTGEVVEEEEEEIIEYSGDVELTINEVIYEVRGDSTKYGKVTGVRFTIDNQKDDFMPKVEVYTYEKGDTSSVFATTPREERIYSTVNLGKTMTQELSIASQQFTDLSDWTMCKVIVKDKVSEKILASETEEFKFES